MKVFISGQKYFGLEIYRLCKKLKFEVVGVCAPIGDRYIYEAAVRDGVKVIPAGTLNADNMIACDLGITAHSHDYIGKKTRYVPRLGWIGYHPSLLPRHRGRSSIEWAIRMGDQITGGTIFWLNGGIDRGDIAYQDWCWIPKKYQFDAKAGATELWRNELLGMGVRLYETALSDISRGIIKKQKQNPEHSTFEPSLDNIKDVYKPDLLLLPFYRTTESGQNPPQIDEDDYIPHH